MPVSVVLPDNFPLKRNLRVPYRHIDDLPLDDEDRRQYDDTTVFYDVFFNSDNTRLCMVGPPLLNLRALITPITITLNGRSIDVPVKEFFKARVCIGEVDLQGFEINALNELQIDFNRRFSFSARLAKSGVTPARLILTTLQKDNKINWIEDWANYYREYFGVEKIVLYDNGSANVDELKWALPGITIEAWPFKHGVTRSHGNKFCQYGSLNHCRLKYGRGSYIFNFDIDELLCYPRSRLDDELERYDAIVFDSYNVPLKKMAPGDYSYPDFKTREIENRGSGFKYIYNSDKVIANNIHFVRTRKSDFSEKIFRQLVRLARKLSRGNALQRLLSRVLLRNLQQKYVDLSQGFYLHYLGITTNWKGAYYDRFGKEASSRPDTGIEPEFLAPIEALAKASSDR